MSPDGTIIASCSADQTIKLWTFDCDQYCQSLQGHLDRVNCIAFNKQGTNILSTSLDKTLKVWDVATGDNIDTIYGHSGYPLYCAWSQANDDIAASCGDDLELFIWDLSTGKIR